MQGSDAHQDLRDRERLGHIVITAGMEARDPVVHRVQGSQEQHRSVLTGGPQRLAHVATVRVRQTDVDHQDLEARTYGEVVQGLVPVAGDHHAVTVHFERLGEHPTHRLVVLADADPGHWPMVPHLLVCHPSDRPAAGSSSGTDQVRRPNLGP